MNRRKFLLSLLGFLSGFAVIRKTGLCSDAYNTHILEDAAITRALSNLFTIPENARVIGIRYLKHYPERANLELLLGVLGPDVAALATADDHTLLNHLNALQRQDFIDGETVIVNNWILSRTEASLCALVALS